MKRSHSKDISEKIPVKQKTVVTDVTNEKQQKKASKRVKNSNFVFTINTNIRMDRDDDDLPLFCKKLKRSCDKMFNSLEDIVLFLEPEHSWSLKHVKKAECQAFIERGEQYDQVHAHCIIAIQHYSKIRLNRILMKELMCQELGVKNIYLSRIQVLRNSSTADLENFVEYAKKNYRKYKKIVE